MRTHRVNKKEEEMANIKKNFGFIMIHLKFKYSLIAELKQ